MCTVYIPKHYGHNFVHIVSNFVGSNSIYDLKFIYTIAIILFLQIKSPLHLAFTHQIMFLGVIEINLVSATLKSAIKSVSFLNAAEHLKHYLKNVLPGQAGLVLGRQGMQHVIRIKNDIF